jgi:hypothetical protein
VYRDRRPAARTIVAVLGAALGAGCTGVVGDGRQGDGGRRPVAVDHWAFAKPSRPALPPVDGATWPRTEIDVFVLAGLERAGLEPGPEADLRALIRRASLDARGLPPRPEEIDAVLADAAATTPGAAYGRLVDRLLDDPAYGEHRARYWLDVARYADTHGFFLDNYRSIWPYRDYVIRAFNDGMPFDRFTVEQLAGDLLPGATLDQRVATGFGRCAMTTSENGTIAEENEAVIARDRVETTAAAFVGLTIGCAACHDHRLDPITQRDYYAFAAFFRNTTQRPFDEGRADAPPVVEIDHDMAAVPTLVTVEAPGTPAAFVLERGRYDRPGERVTADVPRVLPGLPPGQPANRLGLARWLVSPENPLTARVTVNRLWAEIFGAGIVATPHDLGIAGARPTNQALLDWLAVELQESGWDVKHVLRLLLTSATYRQSAAHGAAGDARDPDNRLLSRGPRFRMDAEMIRDQALAASGLLVARVGGPPVKPYQPPGIWEEVAIDESNTREYAADSGDGLYRRSLYTFWKRAAPPPAMEILDAPSRERFTVQRERTNTPVQALVTMNDVQFIEAARQLAARAVHAGADVAARLDALAVRVLARPLDAEEQRILGDHVATFTHSYADRPADAAALIAVGSSPVDASIPAAELAAWTVVASEILNLDEALNK